MNDIEAQIQIANEQIIKSRQMFELKKGERGMYYFNSIICIFSVLISLS